MEAVATQPVATLKVASSPKKGASPAVQRSLVMTRRVYTEYMKAQTGVGRPLAKYTTVKPKKMNYPVEEYKEHGNYMGNQRYALRPSPVEVEVLNQTDIQSGPRYGTELSKAREFNSYGIKDLESPVKKI
jgi:hypothetical protein